MKRKLNYGDIFSLEVAKGKYVFGRILFNVEEQYAPFYNETEIENYLSSYFGCQLVEMYKGIYDSSEYKGYDEILIPRAFVGNIDDRYNKDVAWQKVGHKSIDYTKVEFPEIIGNMNNGIWLMRGELIFQIYSFDDADDAPVDWLLEPYVGVLGDACLFMQGRKDLIEGFVADEYLIDSDLLYHPELRIKLYEEIDRDPKQSYYELSKDEGFDFGRLFNKLNVIMDA